ncbi:hypothetical protein GCM10007424_14870 [Flavobacterium suaedae]|uniref:Uncharacterized protein n=1 Tax=Flavobacterium suaedae TaxID=1767027 RepID=A0ABQ1JVI6_9FLAO|nr:hypothetical protein [Flavobacterium suaedae]GGB75925.1 hypothetical protein GCM10007424_14870 [Flavobacterium suaedae]
MEQVDFKKMLKDMLGVAKTEFSDYWKEVKPYAEKELKSFLDNVKLIAKLKLKNTINEEQAKLHMNLQINSMRMVFLTIEGLGLLAVQSAINSMIDIARNTVNTAIGWTIL